MKPAFCCKTAKGRSLTKNLAEGSLIQRVEKNDAFASHKKVWTCVLYTHTYIRTNRPPFFAPGASKGGGGSTPSLVVANFHTRNSYFTHYTYSTKKRRRNSSPMGQIGGCHEKKDSYLHRREEDRGGGRAEDDDSNTDTDTQLYPHDQALLLHSRQGGSENRRNGSAFVFLDFPVKHTHNSFY